MVALKKRPMDSLGSCSLETGTSTWRIFSTPLTHLEDVAFEDAFDLETGSMKIGEIVERKNILLKTWMFGWVS